MAIQVIISTRAGAPSADLCCCPQYSTYINGIVLGYDFIRFSDDADLNQYESTATISVGGREYLMVMQLTAVDGLMSGYATFTEVANKRQIVNVLHPQPTAYPRVPISHEWQQIKLPFYNDTLQISLYDDRPLVLNAGDNLSVSLYQQIIIQYGDDIYESPYVNSVLVPSPQKNGIYTDHWTLTNPLTSSLEFDPTPYYALNDNYDLVKYQFNTTSFKAYTRPGQISMSGMVELIVAPENQTNIITSASYVDPVRVSMNNVTYPWTTKYTVISTDNPSNALIPSDSLITYNQDGVKVSLNAYLLGYDVLPG